MTTPTCPLWTQNQHGQDPCTIAQEVGKLCDQTYTVSWTNFQESHYVPNNITANECTCSWSIYNLLSACAYCLENSQLTSWNTWTAGCGGYVSNNSYFPSSLRLTQGIPYWASTNPSMWDNGLGVFNVTQASGIAAEAKPDVTGGPTQPSTIPSTSSSSSKTSVGAIAGGVIGGIVIVIISAILIVCLLRRRRRERSTIKEQYTVFNGVQIVTPPHTLMRAQNGIAAQHTRSPTIASLAPSLTSLVSHVPGGYPSNLSHAHGRSISDPGVYMTSPFYRQSPSNAASSSASIGSAAEGRAERTATQAAQRTRMNPPPYSPTGSAAISDVPITWKPRLSAKKYVKRLSNLSGAASRSRSAQSEVSTEGRVGPCSGKSRSHTMREEWGHDSKKTDGGRGVTSHKLERPPAF